MEIPCSWPLHIRSSIANELRLTHLTRSRTLLRRPSGGSYAPDYIYGVSVPSLLIESTDSMIMITLLNSKEHHA